MAAWKYIKGSEKDFGGAPEWAVLYCSGTNCDVYYENNDYTGRWENVEGGGKGVNGLGGFPIIAQRERVTSINDDRLAQDVNALITERGNRYGKFKDGAEIMRDLKQVMQQTEGWSRCTPSQKEALDMIQHKIGRILNGDPTYDDSWKDIAGYATLIVEELNGVSK